MSYAKSITSGAIALFLLFGTVGFGVFSHVCEEDGLEVSYFVPNDEICDDHGHEDHHSNHEDDHADDVCCDEEMDADGCCSTSTELVKVHLEFQNKTLVKAILVQPETIRPIWISEFPLTLIERNQASGNDPPPKLGQDILVEIQQWLI